MEPGAGGMGTGPSFPVMLVEVAGRGRWRGRVDPLGWGSGLTVAVVGGG